MNRIVKVNYKNDTAREFPKNITYYELSKDFQKNYSYPI